MQDQRITWPPWLCSDPDALKFRYMDEWGAFEQMERKGIKADNLEGEDDET